MNELNRFNILYLGKISVVCHSVWFSFLICLLVTNCQAQIHFPDINLKNCLVNVYDTNMDGEIDISEAEAATGYLDCYNQSITNAEGIAYFTNVDTVDLGMNQLVSLPDMSAMDMVHTLWLDHNQLVHLQGVAGMDNLSLISCTFNQLLDLEGLVNLPSLEILQCRSNLLINLPTSLLTLTNLTRISCEDNFLSTLPDLSPLSSLESFYCGGNMITQVPDLSALANIHTFAIQYNQLSELPSISELGVLTSLTCFNNFLTTSSCPSLAPFSVGNYSQGRNGFHRDLSEWPSRNVLAWVTDLEQSSFGTYTLNCE